jgi:hypothetical protein
VEKIYTNLKTVIVRLIILILLAMCEYLIIKNFIINGEHKNGAWVLYFLSLILTFLCVNIIVSFLGVIKVDVDGSLNKITCYRLFSKRVISDSDIIGYYASVYNTRHGTSYGRIIKTSDNRIIELNPGNLKDVSRIDDYLNGLDIEFYGEKRSFYPFTSG